LRGARKSGRVTHARTPTPAAPTAMLSWYHWIIVVVPIAYVLYMAVYSHRYAKSVADYLVAGRVAGRYVLSTSGMMDSLAVLYLVSGAEANYQTGWAMGFWGNILMPLGLFLGLFGYVSVRFRRTRAMSGGQYLEMRYSRRFRIFATCVRVFGEMLTNCIGPAVSARFFIYLLGIPHRTHILGMSIPTYPLFLAICIAMALVIILSGGRIALVIADAIQGIISYPVFVILVVFVFIEFSWSGQVMAVAADRIPGESFLNPYDLMSLRDFNMFALVASVVGRFFRGYAWIGNDHSGMGKTPHEQKMAGILGNWRGGLSTVMVTMLVLTMITMMNHADYAEKAHETRQELAVRVIDEIAAEDGSPLAAAVAERVRAIPPSVHRIGVDPPLARHDNLDTRYQAQIRETIFETEGIASGADGEELLDGVPVGPDNEAEANRREGLANQKFQNFRSMYNQMMLPVTLRRFFPPVLLALCFMLMVLMMVSTDDSRIFNSASALVQDLVLPFLKKPPSPRAHMLLLKSFCVLVCGIFFTGAMFLSQMDFISMFLTISTSIWEVGGGVVVVLGLYWSRGTTAGAYASIFAGGGTALAGIVLQRTWAKSIVPMLDAHGWTEGVFNFFTNVSRPLYPLIDWSCGLHGGRRTLEEAMQFFHEKCPVNSIEISFVAMILALAAYVVVSLLTCREPYDLDRLLHRGKWAIGDDAAIVNAKPRPFWRRLLESFVNITPEYTLGDKIIAWSVFVYSIIYKFFLAFVGVVIWNAFSPWKAEWWGTYFLVTTLFIPSLNGCVTTVWFMWGGIKDIRALLRDLAARERNELDNGMVSADHVSLADQAVYAARAGGKDAPK
jgi:Na+/proline symporter